ncbi:butyrate kinase [Proteocatella sphenisci]|uniref:butyrate kinase n=1 Tax=Proteocatella sphenisci TaxID=181070 RepID=UPI0004B9A751|nr:butyrate kinase [Proteocatella sphenisci]
MKILAINPGSTSTKIGLYEDKDLLFKESIEHSSEELSQYPTIASQYSMRKNHIMETLSKHGYSTDMLSAAVGRGGLLPPVKSGAYEVNDVMADVLLNRPVLEHASNLGGLIAKDIADTAGIPAYIYDSVSVDELSDVARVTGLKEIVRASQSHCLNMRAAAIKTAEQMGDTYANMNLVVAHLGGGISLSAHKEGKMIDIVSDDEGPFSPERSGRLPIKNFINICSKYEINDIKKMVRGNGGLVSLLDTNSALEVQKRIDAGDERAKLVYEAMAYQIAKSIGELAVVLDGEVHAIVITGGIAYSKFITEYITKKVKFIAPVKLLPGENELESLAFGAYRVLAGEETAHIFTE